MPLLLPKTQYEEANAVMQAWAEKWRKRTGDTAVRSMANMVQKFFATRLAVTEFEMDGKSVTAITNPLALDIRNISGLNAPYGNVSMVLYQSPKDGHVGAFCVSAESEKGHVNAASLANIITGIERGFIRPRDTALAFQGVGVIARPDTTHADEVKTPELVIGESNRYRPEVDLLAAICSTHAFSERDGYYIKLTVPKEIPEEGKLELAKGLLPIVQKILQENLNAFNSRLDPHVTQTLKEIDNHSIDMYNFLLGGGETAKYRTDAVKTFPFLGQYVTQKADAGHPEMVINPIDAGVDKQHRHINWAIETKGASLNKVLAESFDTTEAVMKRFVGVPADVYKRMGDYVRNHDRFRSEQNGSELLPWLLGKVDVNKVPHYRKDPKEFEAFVEMAVACCELLKVKHGNYAFLSDNLPKERRNWVAPFPEKDFANLINNTKGKAQHIGGQPGQLMQACRDVKDMANAVAEVLVYPVIGRAILQNPLLKREKLDHAAMVKNLVPAVCDALFSKDFAGENLEHILALSAKWHEQEGALEDKIRVVERKGTWLPLIPETIVPDYVAPGHVKFVSLTNAEQLKREGRRMDHCVGGYSEKCMREPYHILSLRDAQDQPLMTVELKEAEPDSKALVTVVQCRGIKNTAPSKEALQALEWLLQEIKAEHIPIDFNPIRRRKQAMKSTQYQVEDICGFDPMDAARCQNAYEQYKSRGLVNAKATSLDDFLAKTGLAEACTHVIDDIKTGQYRAREELGRGLA